MSFGPVSPGGTIESDWANLILASAFEGTASFIIRKNGSYYEAIKKYGASGAGNVTYGGSGEAGGADGTDAQAVIQAANSVLTSGGLIFFKQADFYYTSTITPLDDVIWIMEGGGRLIYTPQTGDGLYIHDISKFKMYNVRMDASHATFSGNLVHFEADTDNIELCVLADVDLRAQTHGKGTGLLLESSGASKGIKYNDFRNVHVRDFSVGLKLYRNSNGYVNANNFDFCKAIVCLDGFEWVTDDVNQLAYNVYHGCDVSMWTDSTYGYKEINGTWEMLTDCVVWDVPAGDVGASVAAGALDIRIKDGNLTRATGWVDAGTRTRLNGHSTEAMATGVAPTAALWDIGDVVQNSAFPTEVWIKDPTGTMRRLA